MNAESAIREMRPGTSRPNTTAEIWQAIRSHLELGDRIEGALREGKQWATIIEALRDQQADAGTMQRAFLAIREMPVSLIRALRSQDAWQDFAAIFARGTRVEAQGGMDLFFQTQGGPALTMRMLSAVHASPAAQRAFGSEGDLLTLMKAYRGAPAHLEQYINTVGSAEAWPTSDNPFVLSRFTRVLSPACAALPDERQLVALDTQGTAVQRPYRAYHENNRQLCFVSSLEALLKILSSFNAEHFSSPAVGRRRSERAETNRNYLLHLTLEELLQDPESHPARRDSTIIARHLDVVKELSTYVRSLQADIQKVEGATKLQAYAHAFSKIRTYSGGRMWAYFEEHRDQLPAAVATAVDLLSDPLTEISPHEAHALRRGVVSFYLQQVCRVGADVLADVRADLEEYRTHEAKGPEHLRTLGVEPFDSHAAEATVAHILRVSDRELALTEVAEVEMAMCPLRAFRAVMNRRIEQTYAREMASGLEVAQRLFLERQGDAWNWRADSMQESVPMKRLQLDELAAMPFGRDSIRGAYERGIYPMDRRCAALNRDDFSFLQGLVQLRGLGTEVGQRESVMSIASFRELIHGVAVAVRKYASFEAQLPAPALHEALRTAVRSALQGEGLEACPLVFPGRKYLPSQEFLAREGISLERVLDCMEVCVKERNWHRTLPRWKSYLSNHLPRIKMEAQAGLFQDRPALVEMCALAKKFEPRGVVAVELMAAEKLQENVRRSPNPWDLKVAPYLPVLTLSYFDETERSLLRALRVTQNAIETLDPVDLDGARALRASWLGKTLLVGRVTDARHLWIDRQRVSAENESAVLGYQRGNCYERVNAEGGTHPWVASYLSPDNVRQWATQMRSEFIAAAEVPADFWSRLRRLNTEEGRRALHAQGLQLAPWLRSELMQTPEAPQDVWVQRSFLDLVMGIDFSDTTRRQVLPALSSQRFLRIEDGDPIIASPRSRHSGKSLFDVRVPLDYLDWLSREFESPTVREIARAVAQLRRRFVANREKAIAEFRAQFPLRN